MHYWPVMDRGERLAIEVEWLEMGLSINPAVDAGAVELGEQWAPILWSPAAGSTMWTSVVLGLHAGAAG